MVAALRTMTKGCIGVQTDGAEHDGRIAFEQGHALAREAFAQARATGDLTFILLADYILLKVIVFSSPVFLSNGRLKASLTPFISQELAYSEDDEIEGRASAQKALSDFDDAFLALKAAENKAAYAVADQTYPHKPPYRYHDMPKDAFQITLEGHRMRLRNSARRLGLPRLDRTLIQERIITCAAAQDLYLDKQTAACATQALSAVN
jgi:hypothetical protein